MTKPIPAINVADSRFGLTSKSIVGLSLLFLCVFTFVCYLAYAVFAANLQQIDSRALLFAVIMGGVSSLLVGGFVYFAWRFKWIIDRKTLHKEVTEQIYAHISYHDALTGLPNRTLLLDRLAHSFAKVERQGELLALFFINLDRFNLVNDSFGYAQGDQVIKLISERLKKTIRDSDTVARINGDQFAMVLDPIGNINEAAYVAKRVQNAVAKPIQIGNDEITLGASIGVAIYPNDSQNVELLLSYADSAMKKAKKKGGGNYNFYTGDMNFSSSKRLQEEKKLRDALERNEYLLYYQPKLNISSGKLVGMEALLRWRKDNKTMVAPGKFITMLEESGLILPVGEWVLNQACRQNQKWIDEGYDPMVVAVNVSARQFRQLDFVEVVYKAIKNSGMDPMLLEIEVTEGVLMEDTQASTTTLDELKMLGVRIAIDDFGTGYSSLSYLQRYPIDTLKIDRGFVSGLENRSEDAAIATTIVALAHNLRLNIVAEGVETEKQMTFLNAIGCHQLQGFLFSQPVAVHEFEKYLRNQNLLFRNLPGMLKHQA